MGTGNCSGGVLERVPFYRAPAYPYFLGLIYAIFGHGYYIPRLIGIIIGSLSCVLIFLAGRELFSHKIGLLSALLACFYGMFLYFDSMLLTVYLEIFFCLLGMFWLLKWLKNRTSTTITISGLFWGLATITRPNFLVFVPIFAGYVLITSKQESLKKRLTPIGLFITGMLPAVLTVMIINVCIGKDSVLLAWNGGINFYLGNNPSANGWSATSPELDATWWGGYTDAIIIAEKEVGHRLLPSQVSNYWFNRGMNYIFSNPFAWASLTLRKIYLLFNSFELSNNQSIQQFEKFSPLFRIPILNFGFVLAFAIWGLICSIRKKTTRLVQLFLLFYAFAIVIFFVTARYRMPLVPFLMIFASYCVFWIVQKVKERKKKQIVLTISIVAAMIFFVNTDFYGTRFIYHSNIHISLGNRYFASGDYSNAVNEYKEALTYDPDNTDAMNALGNSYMMLGRPYDAEELFKQSINVNKTADALCKLGVINFRSGRMDSAEIYLTDAIVMDSTDPEAYYYIGMFYAYNKKPELAIKNLEVSLRYYPDPQYLNNIHYNLGKLYLEIRNIKEARKHLLQAGVKYKDVSKLLEKLE